MRSVAFVICTLVVIVPVYAGDHCLDHHWFSATHIQEMRLQLTCIGIGLAVWAVALVMGELRRAKR